MGCNTERYMDRLEVQGNAPNSFSEFKKLLLNQYAPLDNKDVVQDKLHAL